MATVPNEKRVSVQINGMWIRDLRIMVSQYDGFDPLARRRFKAGALIAYKSKTRKFTRDGQPLPFLSEAEKQAIYGKGQVYDLTILWDDEKDCPVSKNATIAPKQETAEHTADKFEPSEYQRAILDTLFNSTDHMEIKAYAGSGKTATLVLIVKRMYERGVLPRNVIFLAFNKPIEVELNQRLRGTGCPAQTTHAFGLRILKNVFGNQLEPDNRRTGEIFLEWLCDHSGLDYAEQSFREARKLVAYKLRNAVLELVSHCKNAAVFPTLEGKVWTFGDEQRARCKELFEHYEIEIPTHLVDKKGSPVKVSEPICTPDELVDYALQVLAKCIPLPGQKIMTVAFDDMLYLPVVLNLRFPKFALALTDESQDFNLCQIIMLERLAIDGARIIFVGDPNQALYHFRGADSEAFAKIGQMIEKHGKLVRHKLPKSYRCCQRGVEYCRKWVPDFEGHRKELGTVASMSFGEACERANNTLRDIALPDGIDGAMRELTNCTFAFLCRINVPLIVTAYQLIGQGKRVCVLGKAQIGQPLQRIIQDLCCIDWYSDKPDDCKIMDVTNHTLRISDERNDKGEVVQQGFLSRLADWHRVQKAKLEQENLEGKLEKLEQDVECLQVICTRVKDDKVISALKEIENLFSDEPEPGVIVFATIHKAKGLQWNVTFILRPDLLPFPKATKPEDIETERCCCYVGWSRHMDRAYAVANWPFGNNSRGDLAFETPEEFLGYPESDRPGYARQAMLESLHDLRPQGEGAADAAGDEEDEDRPSGFLVQRKLDGFNPMPGRAPFGVPAQMVEKPQVTDKPKFVDDGKPF